MSKIAKGWKTLTEDELVEFADDFDLCEVIPASTADNVREQEICATYDVGDQNTFFRLFKECDN